MDQKGHILRAQPFLFLSGIILPLLPVAKLPEVRDRPKNPGMQTGISALVNALDAHKPDSWVKPDHCASQLASTGIFHHMCIFEVRTRECGVMLVIVPLRRCFFLY